MCRLSIVCQGDGRINEGVDGAFKKIQAFIMMADLVFCKVTQDNVDQEMVAKYLCCSSTELKGYIQCVSAILWFS
jgi:hypothetical protein